MGAQTFGTTGALSRRELLAGAALTGAVAVAGGASSLTPGAAAADEAAEVIRSDVRYGFLVDTDNCINCKKCVAACRAANHTPENMASRRQVTPYKSDFGKQVYISTSCMHCGKPACAEVCPARAISKRADGIVTVDPNRCIGCKYCYQACPFGVPHYREEGMDKCDCCLSAGVAAGEQPHCAQACMFGALKYGNVEDLLAANHNTARQVEASTDPSLYLL